MSSADFFFILRTNFGRLFGMPHRILRQSNLEKSRFRICNQGTLLLKYLYVRRTYREITCEYYEIHKKD